MKIALWMLYLDFALWRIRRNARREMSANVDRLTWEVQRDICMERLTELVKEAIAAPSQRSEP